MPVSLFSVDVLVEPRSTSLFEQCVGLPTEMDKYSLWRSGCGFGEKTEFPLLVFSYTEA